jgi:hypothetical protein
MSAKMLPRASVKRRSSERWRRQTRKEVNINTGENSTTYGIDSKVDGQQQTSDCQHLTTKATDSRTYFVRVTASHGLHSVSRRPISSLFTERSLLANRQKMEEERVVCTPYGYRQSATLLIRALRLISSRSIAELLVIFCLLTNVLTSHFWYSFLCVAVVPRHVVSQWRGPVAFCRQQKTLPIFNVHPPFPTSHPLSGGSTLPSTVELWVDSYEGGRLVWSSQCLCLFLSLPQLRVVGPDRSWSTRSLAWPGLACQSLSVLLSLSSRTANSLPAVVCYCCLGPLPRAIGKEQYEHSESWPHFAFTQYFEYFFGLAPLFSSHSSPTFLLSADALRCLSTTDTMFTILFV